MQSLGLTFIQNDPEFVENVGLEIKPTKQQKYIMKHDIFMLLALSWIQFLKKLLIYLTSIVIIVFAKGQMKPHFPLFSYFHSKLRFYPKNKNCLLLIVS